jgi:hypothetical protein
MKQISLFIFGAAILFGCSDPEKAQLKHQVDSLNYIVTQNLEANNTLNEVGVLLDSIDASRRDMTIHIIEGISYENYIERLTKINSSIKDSQARIIALEGSLKNSKNISAGSIKRLKTDLEARSREIVGLQMEVAVLRDGNESQFKKLIMKDSIISGKDEVIKLNSETVATLENLILDIDQQNRIKVANLYFGQAQALETAANRTQFAPRKKKEARREALELYKLSLAMGNTKAQERITKLEEELS